MSAHERSRGTKSHRRWLLLLLLFCGDMTEMYHLKAARRADSVAPRFLPSSTFCPPCKGAHSILLLRVIARFGCSRTYCFRIRVSLLFRCNCWCLYAVQEELRARAAKVGFLNAEARDIEPSVLYLDAAVGALLIQCVNVACSGKAFVCRLCTRASLSVRSVGRTPEESLCKHNEPNFWL